MNVINFIKKQLNNIYMDVVKLPNNVRNAPYTSSNGYVFLNEEDCVNYERQLMLGNDYLHDTGWMRVVNASN